MSWRITSSLTSSRNRSRRCGHPARRRALRQAAISRMTDVACRHQLTNDSPPFVLSAYAAGVGLHAPAVYCSDIHQPATQRRDFSRCITCRELSRRNEKQMIKNNSQFSCSDNISGTCSRTARWRGFQFARYPSDIRNSEAVVILNRFAEEASDLSADAWEELSKYYDWSSATWNEAVSLATRHVAFKRNIRTFDDFIADLINILQEQNVATA